MARHVSTSRERLADHPLRATILAVIRDAPGLLLSQLRRRVGGSAGTLQYHLRMLEQGGLIVGQLSPRRHRLFPAGMPPADRRAVALLRSGRFGEVGAEILRQPGATPNGLGAALALKPRTLHLALDGLAREGLVLVGAGPATLWPSPALLRLWGDRSGQGPSPTPLLDLADALRPAPSPSLPEPRAGIVVAETAKTS